MTKPKKPLDDTNLWQTYTQKIKKLKHVKHKFEPALPSKIILQPSHDRAVISAPRPISQSVQPLVYQGRRRFKPPIIEAKVDLHGLRQIQAHQVLSDFIKNCARQGLKNLLIITGKGLNLREGDIKSGVIKQNFPRWLEEPQLRPFIHFYAPAHPKDGGNGAFYVVLRKLARH